MEQLESRNRDPIVVSEAFTADYVAIHQIHSHYIEYTDNNWNHQPKPFEPFKAHLEELRHMGRPVLVARLADHVVGYGALHEFRSADGYWPCVENSVYVHPDHQGHGIGKMLMAALIEQERANGLWAIIAVIDSGNADSIRFHERFGFYECGRMNHIGEKNHRALSVVYLQYDIPENRIRYLCQPAEEAVSQKGS
jgi:phosphinothricin acetyltransferase